MLLCLSWLLAYCIEIIKAKTATRYDGSYFCSREPDHLTIETRTRHTIEEEYMTTCLHYHARLYICKPKVAAC